MPAEGDAAEVGTAEGVGGVTATDGAFETAALLVDALEALVAA